MFESSPTLSQHTIKLQQKNSVFVQQTQLDSGFYGAPGLHGSASAPLVMEDPHGQIWPGWKGLMGQPQMD